VLMAAYLLSDCVGEQIGVICSKSDLPNRRYLWKANKQRVFCLHAVTCTATADDVTVKHLPLLPNFHPNAFFSRLYDAILDQTDSQTNDLEGDAIRALDS